MIRYLILITFLPLFLSCKTTIKTLQTKDTHKIGVKSNRYRGTVFTSDYQTNELIAFALNGLKRFTPTKEDIALAESILKEHIGEANKRHINQFGKRQYIDKNLNKYFRQYVGFISHNGDRTIHINLHWDKFTLTDRINGYSDDRLNFSSDYSIVFDGGSRQWNINVNLSSKTIYGLSVNGVA